MQKRRLGRTGQESTIVIFGGAAFGTDFHSISQEEADRAMEFVLEEGVNHVDVAPSYGDAELRLGPWMETHRQNFFLGCKTAKRTKEEAAEELQRSLERLRVDHFDLYQLHALDELDELEIVLGPGGAMEAILEARDEGLLRFVGITGHRPDTHAEALRRFDFDTVMFPLNFVLRAHCNERNDWTELLRLAQEKDVGLMAIKSIARGPWPTEDRPYTIPRGPWPTEDQPYTTWYEPFDDQEAIDRAVWFTLSQGITGVVSTSDAELMRKVVDAANRFGPLSSEEQAQLVAIGSQLLPLF
jgi:aryl-alcohol dehydrogenase-like predicted oxidoreductase